MKYATNQKPLPIKAQTFTQYTPTYQLNESTGALEEVGVQDDQAIIQSSADCSLSSVLERFGYYPDELLKPHFRPQNNGDVVELFDELDDMFPNSHVNTRAELDEGINFFRHKYDLPEDRNSAIAVVMKVQEQLKLELEKLQGKNKKEQGGVVSEEDSRQEKQNSISQFGSQGSQEEPQT